MWIENLLVFSAFLGFSQTKSFTVLPTQPEKGILRTPLTIDELEDGLYNPDSFTGEWVDDHLVSIIGDSEIVLYNVETGENETVLQSREVTNDWVYFRNAWSLMFTNELSTYLFLNFSWPNFQIDKVIFSFDMSFVLLRNKSSSDKQRDCHNWLIFPLTTPARSFPVHPKGVNGVGWEWELFRILNPNPEPECIQYLQCTGENGLVYVFHNNIYYMPDAMVNNNTNQLTFDGNNKTGIYNGIRPVNSNYYPIWPVMWTSLSDTYLAFYKCDMSKIPKFQIPLYGDLEEGNLYTKYRKKRYAKAGYNLMKTELWLIRLSNSDDWTPRKFELTQAAEGDWLRPDTLHWVKKDKFTVATMNKRQNAVVFHLCYTMRLTCYPFYNYGEPNGWIPDLQTHLGRDRIAFNRPVKQNVDGKSYMHITTVNIYTGSEHIITSGQFSVLKIIEWDYLRSGSRRIYFSGTFWDGVNGNPSETHIYYVSDDGNGRMHYLTCGLRNSAGNLCRFNSADFSYRSTYFIHNCGGPDIPEHVIRHTETGEVDHKLVDNLALRNLMYNRTTHVTKDYMIPLDNGFKAYARLLFPENVDPSKKYPLFVSVYAGPGSASITQEYETRWEETMVNRKNVVVAHIDGRGSGRQSVDFMFSVHRRLGTVEIEDQITVTKWLLQHEPLLDHKQVAIYGWSYGGFATIKVLETDTENIFKCGVSVAPVTNFRLYDAAYSERYMGLPTAEDNLIGYRESDVTTKEHVENLRNKELLLVHGTADETVHYQNSMLLVRSLQKSGILFEQMSYPDEGHGPFGQEISKQLDKSMERFLFRSCFK